MRWAVEGSDDKIEWIELVAFHSGPLAEAAFELEMALRKRKHIRLVAPDGIVHERADLEHLPDDTSHH